MSTQVLVGYDESPQAENALVHALTRFPEASVTVVHVNDPREWIWSDEESAYYSERSYEAVEEAAKRVLDEAKGIAADHDQDIQTAILSGSPAEEIVRYAEENDFDHIVVGSHSRRGLARFLLGSVAERVVRRSPIPVTVMRTPVED